MILTRQSKEVILEFLIGEYTPPISVSTKIEHNFESAIIIQYVPTALNSTHHQAKKARGGIHVCLSV